MSQYIGKAISLVSNSDIRYVGTLHEINSEQSTVSLRNVRSYGTEGRRGGTNEIPASDGVYEFIVFRGSDVKDLKISEDTPAVPTPQYQDPAIIQSTQAKPPQAQAQTPQAQPQAQHQAQHQQRAAPPTYQQQAPAPRAERPAQRQPRQPRQSDFDEEPGRPRPLKAKVQLTEFDFQRNNAKFSKEEQDDEEEEETEKYYNKTSSFFDNISSTTKEQIDGSNEPMTPYQRRGEERKLNMETFGFAESGNRYYANGRGGRGGRGRGRGGRGRGGQGGTPNQFQGQFPASG